MRCDGRRQHIVELDRSRRERIDGHRGREHLVGGIGRRALVGKQAPEVKGVLERVADLYAVDQDGRPLGTFRLNMRLGAGSDPNSLDVSCDEDLAPVDCWVFTDPFLVRVYAKDPVTQN